MRVSFWGVRGSVAVAHRAVVRHGGQPGRGAVPAPDLAMLGYGGNTAYVGVRLSDGSHLVLDAGTGIRGLGVAMAGVREDVHVLLTHLHLDHIMGLLFFGPLFDPASRVTVWGPPGPGPGGRLRERLARYLSAPLSP